MAKIPNIHPGEILEEEFLKPFELTAYRLAKETNIPPTRISQILKGKRSITADTALRFSKFFGNSAEFWLGIQMEYDLREEKLAKKKELNRIKKFEKAS
jgi:addiction module HigA family antidote